MLLCLGGLGVTFGSASSCCEICGWASLIFALDRTSAGTQAHILPMLTGADCAGTDGWLGG